MIEQLLHLSLDLGDECLACPELAVGIGCEVGDQVGLDPGEIAQDGVGESDREGLRLGLGLDAEQNGQVVRLPRIPEKVRAGQVGPDRLEPTDEAFDPLGRAEQLSAKFGGILVEPRIKLRCLVAPGLVEGGLGLLNPGCQQGGFQPGRPLTPHGIERDLVREEGPEERLRHQLFLDRAEPDLDLNLGFHRQCDPSARQTMLERVRPRAGLALDRFWPGGEPGIEPVRGDPGGAGRGFSGGGRHGGSLR